MSWLPHLAQAAYGMGLVGFLIVLGTALGRRIMLKVSPRATTGEGSVGLEATLGLGSISYAVLGLALIGQLRPVPIALVLGLATVWCLGEWVQLAGRVAAAARSAPGRWRALRPWQKAISLLTGTIVLTIFLRALAPPTGYDALMYHIEGPRLFLEEARIFPSMSRWYLNLPLTPEMLFALGMGLGSEAFPQLMELGWLLVFGSLIFSFADRFVSRGSGWVAVGTIFTMPVLPLWASTGNVDFAVGAMDLAAVSFAFLWKANRETRWLALSGLCTGLSLGSKYTSFGTIVAITFLVVWVGRRAGPHKAIRDLAALCLPAAMVALPWYLKSLLWLGDPLFPFLGGGERLDPSRMEAFRTYIESFRPKGGTWASLTLPIDLYLHPERYSEISPALSSPSPVFLAAFLAPWASAQGAGALLLGMAALRFSLSAVTSLEMRFLLPVFTLLSLAATQVIVPAPGGRARLAPLRQLGLLFIVGLLATSLILQTGLLIELRPMAVVLGTETREEYLLRALPTYAAMSYARDQLPQGSRLLTTGDGRTYYCRDACLDTDDQFLWSEVIASSQSLPAFVREVRGMGATHLLVSWQDVEFFRGHIQSRDIQVAVQRLTSAILPACGPALYEDQFAAVYALDGCTGGVWPEFQGTADQ